MYRRVPWAYIILGLITVVWIIVGTVWIKHATRQIITIITEKELALQKLDHKGVRRGHLQYRLSNAVGAEQVGVLFLSFVGWGLSSTVAMAIHSQIVRRRSPSE